MPWHLQASHATMPPLPMPPAPLCFPSPSLVLLAPACCLSPASPPRVAHPGADLEWKLTYVGSAESEKYDQVLDTVFVGPVAPGQYRFVFQASGGGPARCIVARRPPVLARSPLRSSFACTTAAGTPHTNLSLCPINQLHWLCIHVFNSPPHLCPPSFPRLQLTTTFFQFHKLPPLHLLSAPSLAGRSPRVLAHPARRHCGGDSHPAHLLLQEPGGACWVRFPGGKRGTLGERRHTV